MSKAKEGVLRIELEGVKLSHMNWMGGKADCFWQAETPLTTPDGTLLWQGIFRSETIMDTLNPHWKPAEVSIDLRTQYDRHKPLRFSFYDWEANLKPQPMGHFMTSINQLLKSKADKKPDGSWDLAKAIITKTDQGAEFGTIVVVDVEIVETEQSCTPKTIDDTSVLKLTMEGVELAKMNGLFGLSDPFYIVETPVRGPNNAVEWEPFYQSEAIPETVNPRWQPALLNLKDLLCGSKDLDKPIRMSFWDQEDSGRHQPMGYCITSVRRLLKSEAKRDERSGKWELTKALFLVNDDGQEFGRVVVVGAVITSSETE